MRSFLIALLSAFLLYPADALAARAGALRNTALTLTKPNSGTDSRLVPGASAAVTIYRQGMTANETKSVTTVGVSLAVNDIGAARINETFQLNTSASTTMQVTAIASRTSVTIKSTTGSSISVADGDRIVPQTVPTLYSDATGAETRANPLTADSNGNTHFYIYEGTVDYIVSGTGITTTLFTDQPTGAQALFFNALDYGIVGDGATDDQPAMNRLFLRVATLAPDAGQATVFFPRGIYFMKYQGLVDGDLSATVSNVRILGEPGTEWRAATVAQGGTWASNDDALVRFKTSTATRENWIVEGIIFNGQQVGTSGSLALKGIYTAKQNGLIIRNCIFQSFGDPALGAASAPRNDGILLGDDVDSSTPARSTKVHIENCTFTNCVRNGISGLDVEDLNITGCYFDNADNAGIDIEPNTTLQFARSVRITNNYFTNCEIAGVVVIPGSGIRGVTYDDQMEDLTIANCQVYGATATDDGILVGGWRNVTVSQNQVMGCRNTGITVSSSLQTTIIGNTVTETNGVAASNAILVSNSYTVTPVNTLIASNLIFDADGYGISVTNDATRTLLASNLVDFVDRNGAGAGRDGIHIERTTGTIVDVLLATNLTDRSQLGAGIDIVSGTNITNLALVGNLATGNGAGNDISDTSTRGRWVGNIYDPITAAGARHHTSIPYAAALVGSSVDSWVGTFTCAAATTTTVLNNNIQSASRVLLFPANTSAAALIGTANSAFISSANHVLGISFRVDTPGMALGTESFTYVIIDS